VSLWPSAHALVDAHFAGQASVLSDRRLWRHLPRCARCRDRYRARALLEALEPDGDRRARLRIERAVFVAGRPRRAVFGVALVASAALVLLVALPRDDFRARGGAPALDAPGPALAIVRVPPGGAPERVGSVIHAGDPLAFSYVTPPDAGASHLLVFAVDAAGRVYWFWPAWTDPTADPEALAIRASATPVELAEAVRHPLPPGAVTIHALFAHRPYHVREIEAAVAAGRLAALDGQLVSQRLEVLP